jgi:hypothetical protein
MSARFQTFQAPPSRTAKHAKKFGEYKPFASFAPFAVKIGFHLIPVVLSIIHTQTESLGFSPFSPTYTAAGHGAPCPYENPTHLAIAVALASLRPIPPLPDRFSSDP